MITASIPITPSPNDIFVALADPTRRRMIEQLSVLGPVTISQLTEAFPISRQAVTKHLDTLADAGLVETERRGRERIVTFRPEPLREATDWVTTVESRWDRRLAALALLLAAESDVAETAQPTPDRSGRFAMNKNNGEGTTP
ncbi:MAG: metalloregulator ArsR/SmtB family transcription factor [Thermomicrobiales bacterium]|nr:metalloregulator ArsR/SmtB family transcription factor [Thermomicrobiales bacterium]